MKPYHFLYKSDVLYYIQNMPDSSKYYSNETYPDDTFDQDSYNEDLERAKEEAVKVQCKHIDTYFSDLLWNNQKDYMVEIPEGCKIYIINMEEEIEIVEIPCSGDVCPSNWGDVCIPSKKVARIAAPKKEEESIIWNEWLSKVVDGEGYIISTKFREAQKQFEIKRKPL